MNLDIKKVKIVVNIPKGHFKEVRQAVLEAGAGIIGNYTFCSTCEKCVGTFKPNENAKPYIGKKNKLEIVKGNKLEVVCDTSKLRQVIKVLHDTHPYEEPAIEIIPLLDEDDFK